MRELDLKLIELRLLEIINGLHKLGIVQKPSVSIPVYYASPNEPKVNTEEISKLYEQAHRIDQTPTIGTRNVGDIISVNNNNTRSSGIETDAINSSDADITVLSTGTVESRIIELETSSMLLTVFQNTVTTSEKILPSILKRLTDLAGIRN